MKRVLVAGFQHETNTFGATLATLDEFKTAGGWPGMLEGHEVVSGTKGCNLPIAGFMAEAQKSGNVELVPVVWAAAEPSSYVTDEAFETIAGMICEVASTENVDGIYLDLHGAMVTQSHEDGEGELLRRLRHLAGDKLPMVASLDLHANLTEQMVRHASAITIYRTYPHVDMAKTGARAFHALRHLLDGGKLFSAFRQSPFLIPLQAQYSSAEPFRSLYASVEAVGPAAGEWAEMAAGFPAADIRDAGPSVLAYSETLEKAEVIADKIMSELKDSECRMDCSILKPKEAVREAIDINSKTDRAVVIADLQDNPGAGGTSDTVGILRVLVNEMADGAILGMICDPECAVLAHEKGVGAEFEGALGGKAGPEPDPYIGRYKIEALSDGRFAFTGEMGSGCVADTGPTALLRVLDGSGDVKVVVSSRRCQNFDQAIFTHLGVHPENAKIVVVKSSVHFRAAYAPIAAAVLNARSPGLFPSFLNEVDYRNLRPGIRLMPMGHANE